MTMTKTPSGRPNKASEKQRPAYAAAGAVTASAGDFRLAAMCYGAAVGVSLPDLAKVLDPNVEKDGVVVVKEPHGVYNRCYNLAQKQMRILKIKPQRKGTTV